MVNYGARLWEVSPPRDLDMLRAEDRACFDELKPGGDGAGCDYSELSLTYINLAGGSFVGATFERSDLSWSYLGDADLSGSDFGEAILDNADLAFVKAFGANFQACSAVGTIFAFSQLTGDPRSWFTLSDADCTGDSYCMNDATKVAPFYCHQ